MEQALQGSLAQIVETLGGENGIWWLAGVYFGLVGAERI